MARQDVDQKADDYRGQIMDLEKEGDDLEKLETELLRKLQETQKAERDAFTRLEDAMVNGSIPPQMRAATDEASMQKSVQSIKTGKAAKDPAGQNNFKASENADQK